MHCAIAERKSKIKATPSDIQQLQATPQQRITIIIIFDMVVRPKRNIIIIVMGNLATFSCVTDAWPLPGWPVFPGIRRR